MVKQESYQSYESMGALTLYDLDTRFYRIIVFQKKCQAVNKRNEKDSQQKIYIPDELLDIIASI